MKKIFTKVKQFFGLDEQELHDNYEQPMQQYEEPVAPAPKAIQRQVQPAIEEQPANKTFRFPLIQDDESEKQPLQQQKREEKKSVVFQAHQEDETLRLPKHLPTASQVLDVEVSGIRQLLEKRGPQHGGGQVVRINREERPARKRSITKEEASFLTHNPSRNDVEQPVENPAFTNPMQSKKRFTPTHVPSPVYGFQQPRPIRELLPDERNLDLNIPVVIEAEEVIPTEQHTALVKTDVLHTNEAVAAEIVVPQDVEETVDVMEPVEKDNTVSELHENESSSQQPESDVQRISELQLQNVTFENSTVHIGQIHVEPAPVQQPITESTSTISQEIKPAATQVGGSKLPFNVLMLKSDKEKAQANPLNAIKTGVPKTIIDKVEMRRDAQNGLKEAGIPLPKELQDDLDGDLATKPLTTDVTNQEVTKNGELNSEKKYVPLENEQLVQSDEVQHLDEIEQRLLENYKVTQQQVADELVRVPSSVATLEKEQPIFEEFLQRAEEDYDDLHDIEEITEQAMEQIIIEQPIASLPVEEMDVVDALQQVTEPSIDIEEVMEVEQQLQTIVESAHSSQQAEQAVVHRYEKPSYNFLVPPELKTEDKEWMDEQADYLIEALQSHQIQAQVASIVQGPAVTQFEITVAAGTKVSKVRNLSDDIKLALAAKDIRIDAPIPGKRTIGIEIPNRIARAVRLSEVTDSAVFKESDSPLEAALGLDLNGKPVTLDLRKMPHGLIAGATGSGKSVCINSILVSLLYKADPHELKLMLIDPKMVELAPFNHIPHLVSPVITDVKAATAALKWAVEEMERRYALFMHAGVRDITRFNSQAEKAGQHAQKMPYLLIVIDELADLMMMSPADVEEAICRLAQKARACGIHLIVATQRPSVDVITGLIKSNIPTRIAFAVSSAVDSRTILDGQGAERLLGRGDMLYLGNGMSAPDRLQGTFVTDDEIEEIIDYVRSQGEPQYLFQHDELLKKAEFVEEQDELFEEVCRYVFEQGSASASAIQRRYHLGYNRAARLVEMLERNGFVSEQKGSKPRDVFITEADLENLFS